MVKNVEDKEKKEIYIEYSLDEEKKKHNFYFVNPTINYAKKEEIFLL